MISEVKYEINQRLRIGFNDVKVIFSPGLMPVYWSQYRNVSLAAKVGAGIMATGAPKQ